jgi:ABC-type glycerol-3-phosphate transport system permease component
LRRSRQIALLTPLPPTFHFKFRFRRVLLIIIINAFVLPQVDHPAVQLWRQTGLIDNYLAVLILTLA